MLCIDPCIENKPYTPSGPDLGPLAIAPAYAVPNPWRAAITQVG